MSGYISCGTLTAAGDGIVGELIWGTGTAPANGVAPGAFSTGTTFEYTLPSTSISGDTNVPFSTSYIVPSLTVGTAYWFDLGAKYLVATGCAFKQVLTSAIELN
jgi:hypothetical protein